ncbi:MAG: hypothetical protein JEZ06_00295 [Anaerolineaceae bacterium]|nr:hypothetical protein [Anaerolineaceae bacterium]
MVFAAYTDESYISMARSHLKDARMAFEIVRQWCIEYGYELVPCDYFEEHDFEPIIRHKFDIFQQELLDDLPTVEYVDDDFGP